MAQNREPALGLIILVPVIHTDPDLAENPWGDNEGTPGLTPHRLLADLRTVFAGVHPDYRDHWHSNPCKMPDQVVRMLPRVVVVLAKWEILYKSGAEFRDRLQALGVEVDCKEVDGLHQAKDMDEVTEAGRAVREYVTQKMIEFVKQAKCSADEGPSIVPGLKRQDAMKGLEATASQDLPNENS